MQHEMMTETQARKLAAQINNAADLLEAEGVSRENRCDLPGHWAVTVRNRATGQRLSVLGPEDYRRELELAQWEAAR